MKRYSSLWLGWCQMLMQRKGKLRKFKKNRYMNPLDIGLPASWETPGKQLFKSVWSKGLLSRDWPESLESRGRRSEAPSAPPWASCLPQPVRGNFQSPTVPGEGLEKARRAGGPGQGAVLPCLPAKGMAGGVEMGHLQRERRRDRKGGGIFFFFVHWLYFFSIFLHYIYINANLFLRWVAD